MYKITENIFPLEWNLSDPLKVPYHGKKIFGTFVCGGGSTMGYKLAGFNHIGGVEFTEHYSKIYQHNHKPQYFFMQDIRDFNLRTDLPEDLFNLDMLDGSPPCAAFSTAGARERIWGKKSEYEGKVQVKDDLVYFYCDTIEKLSPKVFLLENVSGLAKGNAKIYLKNIVDRLSEKYNVQVFLLYAASMGIPQIRNRVFIIGHKKEFNLQKLQLNFDCPPVNFDITQKYWYDEMLNKPYFYREDTDNMARWHEIKEGKTHKVRFNFAKNSPKKPSYTITESTSNLHTSGVSHHLFARKLNIEEVRMVCTFPKDYDFLDLNGISVMGRSVLPVMMANISYQIYLQWLSKI